MLFIVTPGKTVTTENVTKTSGENLHITND